MSLAKTGQIGVQEYPTLKGDTRNGIRDSSFIQCVQVGTAIVSYGAEEDSDV